MPANGAALSSAGATGCALHGASLSLVSPRESNQREGAPCIRVWPLRDQTSLTPALLRGHVTKGHPCPFIPRSASMPRVPLRNACIRPPEGEGSPRRLKAQRLASLLFALFLGFAFRFSMHGLVGETRFPFRRVSGIVAQGVEPHGRGERLKGPRMALVSRPLERRWSERTLRAAQGRMQGRVFFCLLFFAPGGDPRAKKSEAPCKAQPVARAEESSTSATSVRATHGGKRCAVFHPTTSPMAGNSDASCSAHPVAAAEPSQPLTSTTTPSTPADSPPAAAAPPHSPAPCSDRSRSAAARTAPARRASRPAAGRRPCRSPLR